MPKNPNGNPCKSLEDERKPLEMLPPREKRNEDKYLPSRKRTGGEILNGWLARDTDLELEGGATCLVAGRYEGNNLRKAGRVSPNTEGFRV